MNHLINPLFSRSFRSLSDDLSAAHRFLTDAATQTVCRPPASNDYWAVSVKRLNVEWIQEQAPSIVGKNSERFQEMVNILATLEHLRAAIRWFSSQPEFRSCLVVECHPSTSDSGTNDLVVGLRDSSPVAVCEVTDIVSSNAGQNNKEDKDRVAGADALGPGDGAQEHLTSDQARRGSLASMEGRRQCISSPGNG